MYLSNTIILAAGWVGLLYGIVAGTNEREFVDDLKSNSSVTTALPTINMTSGVPRPLFDDALVDNALLVFKK